MLLAMIMGWTGAHRFYLGDTKGGWWRLALTLPFGLSVIVGIIEANIYSKMSDEEFVETYIVQKKKWF